MEHEAQGEVLYHVAAGERSRKNRTPRAALSPAGAPAEWMERLHAHDLSNLDVFTSGEHHISEGAAAVSGEATIVARGKAVLFVFGNARATGYDGCRIFAADRAQVKVFDTASAEVSGDSRVVAYDQAMVKALGRSKVEAFGLAHIIARENASIDATDSVRVDAYEDARVRMYKSTRLSASGRVSACIYDDSRAWLRELVTAWIYGRSLAMAEDSVVIVTQNSAHRHRLMVS